MLEASEAEVAGGCDIFIASAAVADYRPENLADHKIKKSSAAMSLALVRNPDTLATIAARPDAPFTVGFAAETRDLEHYARDKMQRKKLDMIVANDVSAPGIGFNSDQNAVSVFWEGGRQDLGPEDKTALARDIVALVAERTAGA
jgi:phosphopantothenoylcysteine decarboxylase/phosphopantothenate--cysteine ligase